jgi:hypothetical protein
MLVFFLQILSEFVKVPVLQEVPVTPLHGIRELSIRHGIVLKNLLLADSQRRGARIIRPAECNRASILSAYKFRL